MVLSMKKVPDSSIKMGDLERRIRSNAAVEARKKFDEVTQKLFIMGSIFGLADHGVTFDYKKLEQLKSLLNEYFYHQVSPVSQINAINEFLKEYESDKHA
jgi:hypothetical protein